MANAADTQAPPAAVPAGGQTDVLANLRDIHLPGPVEAWPPAIGWWLVALLALLAVLLLIRQAWRYWRGNAYRREAARALTSLHQGYEKSGDLQAYVRDYNELLKRVALTGYPRESVAALTGEAWVAFLDQTSGSHEFSMGKGQVLIQGQYQLAIDAEAQQVDIEALQQLGRDWIKRHKPVQECRNA